MAIPKTSKIAILSGIEIDNTYQHSYWFANKNAQDNYFDNLSNNANYSVYKGNQFAFIRPDTNTVRVAVRYNKAKTGNYLFFENYTTPTQQVEFAPFKRYYAFIDDVRYIDDNLVEIDYTIDVIQTYLFDFEFANCFVEREHTQTDLVGEHTVPEDLTTGEAHVVEVYNNNMDDPTATQGWLTVYTSDGLVAGREPYTRKGVIQISFIGDKGFDEKDSFNIPAKILQSGITKPDYFRVYYDGNSGFNTTINGRSYNEFMGYVFDGGYINNQYSPLKVIEIDVPQFDTPLTYTEQSTGTIYTMSATSFQNAYFDAISQIISQINANKADLNIVNVVIKPTGMDGFRGWSVPDTIIHNTNTFKYRNGDEYKIKNNKLRCHPYNYVQVDTNMGSSKIYKFEYCSLPANLLMTLQTNFTSIPTTEAVVRPQKIFGNTTVNNVSVGLTFDPTVEIQYDIDGFDKWKAQHGNQALFGGLFGTAQILGGAGLLGAKAVLPSANISGGASTIASGVTRVSNIIGDAISAGDKPHNLGGSSNTRGLLRALGFNGYTAYKLQISAEYAKIIDDYFTMYGYKVNSVKIPSIHNRKGWTHLKTNNCIVHRKNSVEGYSTNVETNLCAIFDNGITFWNIAEGYNVGDYDKENSLI